jgi:hypothetical protein
MNIIGTTENPGVVRNAIRNVVSNVKDFFAEPEPPNDLFSRYDLPPETNFRDALAIMRAGKREGMNVFKTEYKAMLGDKDLRNELLQKLALPIIAGAVLAVTCPPAGALILGTTAVGVATALAAEPLNHACDKQLDVEDHYEKIFLTKPEEQAKSEFAKDYPDIAEKSQKDPVNFLSAIRHPILYNRAFNDEV